MIRAISCYVLFLSN